MKAMAIPVQITLIICATLVILTLIGKYKGGK